jgi:hypothetical protein
MFDTVRHRPSERNVGRSAKLVLTAAAVFTLLAGGTALATTSTASGNDTHQGPTTVGRAHGLAVSKAAHECPKGSDTAAGAAKGAEKSSAAQAKRAAKSAARTARGKS